MRKFAAIALASALVTSSAFAAGSQDSSPLAAGKPAGVKNAQLTGNGFLLIAGLAVVAGGIALVVSSGSGNNVAVTTSSTSTSP